MIKQIVQALTSGMRIKNTVKDSLYMYQIIIMWHITNIQLNFNYFSE